MVRVLDIPAGCDPARPASWRRLLQYPGRSLAGYGDEIMREQYRAENDQWLAGWSSGTGFGNGLNGIRFILEGYPAANAPADGHRLRCH